MKRTSNGDAVDSNHPALSFHREVIIIQQWTKIRRAFLQALEAAGTRGGVVQWREPRKLWRHAQEALGKWILSQVARVHLAGAAADQTPTASALEPTASLVAELHEADIRFFPTEAQLRKAATHTAGPSSTLATYDAQLVRDLSLKSNGTHDAAAVDAIVQLVKDFDLPRRCIEAAEAVEAALRDVTPSQALRPLIRRIEAADPQRTAQQQRIAGPIAEVSVRWPRHWRRELCRDCPAVSLPWAAIEKLRTCYDFFSEAREHQRYDGAAEDADAARQQRFELRASTVILRYEGGLATGSLQLCADTRLKQHLHAAGYHVMDLCASPINAYMGVPQTGCFSAAAAAASESKKGGEAEASPAKDVPNFFCSAFFDTDRYFGSMGSAVAVDPLHLYHVPAVNPQKKPLLLTLDVPYDEDLCELLFQKLVKDMHRATAAASSTSSAVEVDYVLVLPLWWDIQMNIQKRFFAESTDAAAGDAAPSSSSSPVSTADAEKFIRDRAAMLEEGYKVPYTWPAALAEAAGDARVATAPSGDAWVCFDSVFIDDRYGYFCTATNQWLHGVTTTEVIGLAQPRLSVTINNGSRNSGEEARKAPPLLQQALDAFYSPAAAPTLA